SGRIIGSGIAYASNTATNFSVFAGQVVDSTSILLKSTYIGDGNLDGKVNIKDLQLFISHWNTSGFWTEGDFNYDGLANSSDLNLLAVNWNAGVASPLAAESFVTALASVPEPASLGALMLSIPMLLQRRRRR